MAAVASNALPLTFGVRKGDTKERMKDRNETNRERQNQFVIADTKVQNLIEYLIEKIPTRRQNNDMLRQVPTYL